MQPEAERLLQDILDSIQAIEGYLGEERNYFEFLAHRMMKRAIERELEIIGEAVRKLCKYKECRCIDELPLDDAAAAVNAWTGG